MNDFLKAEWKTLVLVVIAAGAVYLLLVRESAPPRSETHPPTVTPGVAIDGIQLGVDTQTLQAQLGEPVRKDVDELDLEVWHWEAPPVSIFLHEGRATAIERHLDDDFRPRLEGGTPIGTSTEQLARELGQPIAQYDIGKTAKLVRFRGLMVHVDHDAGLASVTVAGVPSEGPAKRSAKPR